MQIQIITPEKVLYSGNVAMVEAPGAEGDFGVLPGHAPFITTLRAGEIVISEAGGNQQRVAIESGVAEVTPEKCVLLIEKAAA